MFNQAVSFHNLTHRTNYGYISHFTKATEKYFVVKKNVNKIYNFISINFADYAKKPKLTIMNKLPGKQFIKKIFRSVH